MKANNSKRRFVSSLLAIAVAISVVPASSAVADDAPFVSSTAASGSLDSNQTIRNSTLGFYEYIGAQDAVSWFNQVLSDPQKASKLRIGSPDSATNLDTAIQSVLDIKRGNVLRTSDENFPGRQPLRVSYLISAMAETSADWMLSSNSMSHQNFNPFAFGKYTAGGQNIAAGYRNPFDGWYTQEKAAYDHGEREDQIIGHYTNLTSSDFNLTGFGWAGVYSSQNFAFSSAGDPGLDADTYVSQLVQYRTLVEHNGAQPENDGSPTTVYRLYNPYTGWHHYTTSKSEVEKLVAVGWKDEGKSFNASSKGYPVYRLYNPYNGLHHYTLSQQEANGMAKNGWRNEGIGWYSPSNGTVPVYRLYNPYSGEHMYTIMFSEYETVAQAGWTQENVAWIAE